MDGTTEVFSLRNFGQRRNCTLLSMSPVEVQVLPFRVGAPNIGSGRRTRAAPPHTKVRNNTVHSARSLLQLCIVTSSTVQFIDPSHRVMFFI